jgi:hypothetical protein
MRWTELASGFMCGWSCKKYFRKLEILPLKSQYIYSLSLFVINNSHHFEVNSEVHSIKTRTKSDFHYPSSNLSVFQKGTYYTEIKVFNSLLASIKDLSHNIEQFKKHLKTFYVLIHFIL